MFPTLILSIKEQISLVIVHVILNTMIAAVLLAHAIGSASAYDNGVAATPPMGWSTWCTNDICGIPDRCSEYEVRNKADAMVEQGMVDMGYNWILLDDCWADKSRDENDELQPSPKLFPSGMPALADYVHSKGMKLGLYTCIGTQTCKKGRPGSYGHYETDANTFAKWNVDMVKADNCHHPDTNETQQELFTQFSQALNATGHPMLFHICNWGEEGVLDWGPKISQMYRTQMDHIPLWQYPPQAAGEGYGQGTKEIIDYMADLHPNGHNGPYQWMDPDFLETLFEPITMNYTNSRTEMAFWTLWSAPLLVATDPADMSDEKKSILMNPEVLAVANDPLFTSGERLYNKTNGAQLWSRKLSNDDLAVIAYNSDNFDELSITFTAEELGWMAEDEVNVRCLWGRKDVGKFEAGSFTTPTIPVHDHFYYRLSRTTSA